MFEGIYLFTKLQVFNIITPFHRISEQLFSSKNKSSLCILRRVDFNGFTIYYYLLWLKFLSSYYEI